MGFDSKESVVSELVGAIEEEQRAEGEMNRYWPGDDYPKEYKQAKHVWQEAQKYRKQCEKAVAEWDKPVVRYDHR